MNIICEADLNTSWHIGRQDWTPMQLIEFTAKSRVDLCALEYLLHLIKRWKDHQHHYFWTHY